MNLQTIFEYCFEGMAQAEADLYDPALCAHHNSNCATFGGNDMVAKAMMHLTQIVKTRHLSSLQEVVREAPVINDGDINTYHIIQGLAEQAETYSETGSITFDVNYNQFEIWTMQRIHQELNAILSQMVE